MRFILALIAGLTWIGIWPANGIICPISDYCGLNRDEW